MTAVVPNPVTAGIAAVAAPVLMTSSFVSAGTDLALAGVDAAHGCDPTDELMSAFSGVIFGGPAKLVGRQVWCRSAGSRIYRRQQMYLYEKATRIFGSSVADEVQYGTDYNPYGR